MMRSTVWLDEGHRQTTGVVIKLAARQFSLMVAKCLLLSHYCFKSIIMSLHHKSIVTIRCHFKWAWRYRMAVWGQTSRAEVIILRFVWRRVSFAGGFGPCVTTSWPVSPVSAGRHILKIIGLKINRMIPTLMYKHKQSQPHSQPLAGYHRASCP